MRKSTICNLLGARYGYRSYLEISTPTTGWQHELIDRNQFTRCERLVYALPLDQQDKADVTYHTALTTSSELVRRVLAARREHYDLVFVDPHHTYENSYQDLAGALQLVRPGGIIVVHDCNPADASIALPDYQIGEWCGVTYWAFIDLVRGRANLRYFTVDCDYGCGVIYKLPHTHAPRAGMPASAALENEWMAARWNDDSRYQLFDRNRAALLNLWTVDEFISRLGLPLETAEPDGPVTTGEARLAHAFVAS